MHADMEAKIINEYRSGVMPSQLVKKYPQLTYHEVTQAIDSWRHKILKKVLAR